MLVRIKQLLGAYERARDFLNRNPLPNPPAKYAERREEMESAVARLNAMLADQSSGLREGKDGTKREKTAVRTLRRLHLAPISRLAKAFLPQEPEIQKALSMPEASISTSRLLAVATGMRQSAEPYEQLFVDNGRPGDFLARLDAAIEAVRDTVLGRARSRGLHVGATAGLKEELKRTRRCVQMLDAMVLDAFAGHADVIAQWRVAKRVKEAPGPTFRGNGGTAEENLEPPKAA